MLARLPRVLVIPTPLPRDEVEHGARLEAAVLLKVFVADDFPTEQLVHRPLLVIIILGLVILILGL